MVIRATNTFSQTYDTLCYSVPAAGSPPGGVSLALAPGLIPAEAILS